jgi:hypothetical protein
MWLASQLHLLSCYCTYHYQPSQALSFIKRARLMAFVMDRRLFFNHSMYLMLPKTVRISSKLNIYAFYASHIIL